MAEVGQRGVMAEGEDEKNFMKMEEEEKNEGKTHFLQDLCSCRLSCSCSAR